MSAPKRIWAASVTENYGEWQTTTDGMPRPTEYVRADLYAALEAQLAETQEKLIEANDKLIRQNEALSRTGAVTDAMVEAGLEYYAEGGCGGLADYERREVVEAIIEAALKAAMEAGR